MTTQRELKDRYPYMFSGKNIGISIPHGWMPIFEKLCEDIDTLLGQDKQGFHFVQLKEKFGSARWYWVMDKLEPQIRIDIMGDDGVRSLTIGGPDKAKAKTPVALLGERIGKLVSEAETKTEHSCIVCGEPSKADRHEYWVLQVCDVHKKMRRTKDGLPTFWPSEDER